MLRASLRRIVLIGALTAICIGGVPCAPADAQPVNPRVVAFPPSPDHWVVLPYSVPVPVIRKYVLEIYEVGGKAPVHTVDLGKPAPDRDGYVRYDFGPQLAAGPLAGGSYEARVNAVGPFGQGRSGASNRFSFQFCQYSLSSYAFLFRSEAGSDRVTVTTSASCRWQAWSGAPWITVDVSQGIGTATLTMKTARNTTRAPRAATVTIGGKAVTITQGSLTPPGPPQRLRADVEM